MPTRQAHVARRGATMQAVLFGGSRSCFCAAMQELHGRLFWRAGSAATETAMRRYGGLGEDSTRQDAATTQRAAILMSPWFHGPLHSSVPGLVPAGRTRLGVFLLLQRETLLVLVRLASVWQTLAKGKALLTRPHRRRRRHYCVAICARCRCWHRCWRCAAASP